jgi:ketosteroid isomerase-like protein
VSDPESAAADVRRVVAAINEVWRVAAPEDIAPLLQPYFADEMKIVGLGFTPVGSGRDVAIESYVDFARVATIASFEMDEPDVHAAGDSAVATYRWHIRYTLDATEFDESGHDVFVLRRHGGRWLATWRAMLPD